LDWGKVVIEKYQYRGIGYESRDTATMNFGYIYLPYGLFPEELVPEWFQVANVAELPSGRVIRYTPIPEIAKRLTDIAHTRIAFNGAEWRTIVGLGTEDTYLALWWDYNHYGWGPPTVRLDAEAFIDALIEYVNEYGVYKVRCPNCGILFAEETGWEPNFGKWTGVCPACVEKVQGYKESLHEDKR
jgi:hypothetical protein